MKKSEVLALLNALLERAPISFKQEIEQVIEDLKIRGDDDNDSSPPSKKDASKLVNILAKFFLRVGSNVAAKELLDSLHNLF